MDYTYKLVSMSNQYLILKLLNIYNLGSGQSVSIKEVVEKILKLTGSQANIKVSNKIRKGEVIDTISDISKIKKDLNWQPKVFIDDGLKLILNN